MKASGAVSNVAATTGGPKVNFAKPALHGKQRNAFGSYIVVNKDTSVLEIWGYEHTAADSTGWKKFFTTPTESSIQFLGSHELYWWPHMQLLLVRLGDGISFKFYRFASNF